jgi:hypothetical protein
MAEHSQTPFRAPEPPITEMLADPLVHLVMKRDGVSREEILRVMRTVNSALRPASVDGSTL